MLQDLHPRLHLLGIIVKRGVHMCTSTLCVLVFGGTVLGEVLGLVLQHEGDYVQEHTGKGVYVTGATVGFVVC